MKDNTIQQALFCPANKPALYRKALQSEADLIVFDWEDAVSENEKQIARSTFYTYLEANKPANKSVAIRINAANVKTGLEDLLFLTHKERYPDYIVLPKSESASIFEMIRSLLPQFHGGYIPMVETAKGVNKLYSILSQQQNNIDYVMVGAADLSESLHTENSRTALAYAYGKIVAVCGQFDIPVIDTPFFDIHDPEKLKADTEHGKKIGFSGRAAIHPKQLTIIKDVYRSTPQEIKEAQQIIALGKKGVGTLNGKMIDRAMVLKAQRIVKSAT